MNFDMIRFCEDNHIGYTLQGKNVSRGWIGLQDPWKGHDTGYHMGWNLSGCYLYSWSTGGHSLFSWMKEVVPNVDYRIAIETYGDVYVDRRAEWSKKTAQAETLEFHFEKLGKVARKYLTGRGFDADMLEDKYNLKWGGNVDPTWHHRIIIPIYHNGVLVSWQGRSVAKDAEIRYLTLGVEKSVMDPKSVFFNWDNATGSVVIVNEGPFDSMRLGDGAIATLGTSTTEAQVRLLKKFKKVIVLFDPEKNALIRAEKFAQKVAAMGINVEVVDTEADDDVGAMPQEEADKLKKELLG